jgi:hypothetical protein
MMAISDTPLAATRSREAYTAGKRGRKARRVIREIEETGPTPETMAKLRPDQVLALHTKGLLSDSQKFAAEEIREVHDAVSALWLKGNWPSPTVETSAGGGPRPRHHLDGMAPRLQKLHRRRYLPWVALMAAERFGGLRWSQILIEIIVDGQSVEDYPEGVLAVLWEGLDRYA